MKKSTGVKNGKIQDLDVYLTNKTGMDKDDRQLWRDCIDKLMLEADAEKDPGKKAEKEAEVMRVFGSMSYWKVNYANK